MTPILTRIVDWYCPQCGKTDTTREAKPHTRYHACPKLRFLATPLVEQGTAAKVEIREREDYIDGEMVQLDPEQGRPVMSMTTTTDKGQDVRVYAPAATGGVR